MRLSLRTLLAFEDNIFDHEQHKQLERVIPQHDAALNALNRIRSVVRNPRLGVPGLVDQREELDPNLVAEYLDHQMSEEIQERFEAYCLSSDKYLAELASVHKVLASVLGEPARTSRECRLRCYDLYRQTAPSASIAAFEERQPTEKTDQESFLSSSRQLFEDYLQASPFQKSPATQELPQCPGAAQAANRSDTSRPELIPFFRKNETENNSEYRPEYRTEYRPESKPESNPLPPHHLTQPQFIAYSAPRNPAPPVISISSPALASAQNLEFRNSEREIVEEHWTTSGNRYGESAENNAENAGNNVARHVDNKAVPNAPHSTVTKSSFPSRFWSWLTTSTPQKTESSRNQENQKSTSKGTPVLILMLCAVALFGWNRLQQKNNDSISKTSSEISEKAEIPESTKSNSVTISEQKGATEEFDPWAPTPQPLKKESPKPAPRHEEQNKKTPEVAVAKMVSPQDSIVPSQLPEPLPVAQQVSQPEVPPALIADPFQRVASETPEKKTEKKQEVPVVTEETKSQPTANDQSEKAALSPPNPVHSENFETVIAPNNLPKPAVTSQAVSHEQVLHDQKPSMRSFVEQVSAKHDEPVKDELKDNTLNSVYPKPERKPQLIASPEEKEQFGKDSLIAFQPITTAAKQREAEMASSGFVNPNKAAAQPDRKKTQVIDAWMTSVANQQTVRPEKGSDEKISNEPTPIGRVVLKEEALPRPPAPMPPNPSNVIMVGDVQETTDQSQNSRPVGRVLSAKEPTVVFSASTSSEQWVMKRLPMQLYANQYLLTTAPFSAELELEGGFRIEMVGDSKLSVLEPDANGVPGIFIDYGRLVIHPGAGDHVGAVRPLRIQTERVQGVVRLIGSKSLIFVDTFAEILENVPGETSLLPKARPILGLLPDLDERISWQTGKLESPLVATKQAGIILVPDKPELVNLQGLPNWLSRLPLPQEGEAFAKACRRIFDETGGDCEVALNRLIRESSIGVRSLGYRLWGDLGRFDIPLTFLSEANPDDEPIRQMLVPYFREVMKRDEETVQRLADAIEAVRR